MKKQITLLGIVLCILLLGFNSKQQDAMAEKGDETTLIENKDDKRPKTEGLIIKEIKPFKKVGRFAYGATYVKFIDARKRQYISLGSGVDDSMPNVTTIVRTGENSVRIETDTDFIPSVTGAQPFMLALKEGARFRFVGEVPCFLVKAPSSLINVYPYPAAPPFKLSLTFSEGAGEYIATPLSTPHVEYKKIIFRGYDNVNPLTFVLKDIGFVYTEGKGKVIFPDGKKKELGVGL